MTAPMLSELHGSCFEGMIPSVLATCDATGMPNATWLTHVARVDATHVAASCQFFRKTVANLRDNPLAQLLIVDPHSFQQYRLNLAHCGMQGEGSLFEAMRVRIQAIAAATGMADVFALEAVALFEVANIELLRVERPTPANAATTTREPLKGLARLSEALSLCTSLASVTQTGLELLASHLGHASVTLYVFDEAEQSLYALASRGFAPSGVGASIALGVGVVGTCARHRMAIHIPDIVREFRYGRAAREQATRASSGQEREIPLPSLAGAHSCLATPIMLRGKLFGVLTSESRQRAAFDESDGPLLQSAGQLIAQSVALFQAEEAEADGPDVELVEPKEAKGRPLRVRYYEVDDSVFLDDEYLIKGVSGRVLWLMLTRHVQSGRSAFSNRELRLDPALRLSGFKDNLETRLLMLQRRLEERRSELRIHREQRGRVRLALNAVKLQLEVVPSR